MFIKKVFLQYMDIKILANFLRKERGTIEMPTL